MDLSFVSMPAVAVDPRIPLRLFAYPISMIFLAWKFCRSKCNCLSRQKLDNNGVTCGMKGKES